MLIEDEEVSPVLVQASLKKYWYTTILIKTTHLQSPFFFEKEIKNVTRMGLIYSNTKVGLKFNS